MEFTLRDAHFTKVADEGASLGPPCLILPFGCRAFYSFHCLEIRCFLTQPGDYRRPLPQKRLVGNFDNDFCDLTSRHGSLILQEQPGANQSLHQRTTLQLMKAALSSVLTDAVELDGLLKSNPALAITSRKKRNRVGTSRPDVNPMTTKQRDAFLAHALVREQQGLLPYSLRIMWTLRVKTGLRPEEAYGMHVGRY